MISKKKNIGFFWRFVNYPYYFKEIFTVELNSFDPSTPSRNDRFYDGSGNISEIVPYYIGTFVFVMVLS